jgi:hypothetical protein
LAGDLIEIGPRLIDPPRLDREAALAPLLECAHQPRPFEHTQMLGHRLPGHMGGG